MNKTKVVSINKRFRGLLPVIIDVETAGLNSETDALLEIAAVFVEMDQYGNLSRAETLAYHVEPFLGANIDPNSLEINGINPRQALRFAIPEKQALHNVFRKTRTKLTETKCQRAVLVGHNAWFDLAFVQAAMERSHIKKSPFHRFTTFDTACLSGVALGETVLARAARKAKIRFNPNAAHSAIYDAEKTADLFCHIVNLNLEA